MRDDEHGAVAALAVGVHAVADGGQSVDVQTGVGFVQDGKLGLQQQELEHLDLLFLAAREAHAQLAVEVGGIHVELCRELLDATAELLALHLQAGAAGDAGAQKARQRHARNLDRGLEAQEQAGARALVGGEFSDVLAVKDDAAVVDPCKRTRVAHDQVAEGGLAGAVGSHQNVGLAGGDVEVDVVEDGLLRPRRPVRPSMESSGFALMLSLSVYGVLIGVLNPRNLLGIKLLWVRR